MGVAADVSRRVVYCSGPCARPVAWTGAARIRARGWSRTADGWTCNECASASPPVTVTTPIALAQSLGLAAEAYGDDGGAWCAREADAVTLARELRRALGCVWSVARTGGIVVARAKSWAA